MKKLLPYMLGLVFFIVPLFPGFITLTSVSVPGVSLLPPDATLALLALCAVIGVVALTLLIATPGARSPILLPLVLWVGAALLAAVLGFDPLGGLLFVAIAAAGIVWHSAIVRWYAQPHVARAIFAALLSSGTLASIAAIAMVIVRVPSDQYTIGHGRAIGTFILPGELAGYLIVFLPISFAIWSEARGQAMRLLAGTALAVGALAFVLTFSRAGWMGMAAAVAFYAYVRNRAQRRYAPLIVLVGLAAVLVVFNAHHDPSENYTRLSIWQAGIEIVRRFPLTGVGPLDFARIYPLVRLPDGDARAFHAHSVLLTTFAETGIVGLSAMLFAWWRFAAAMAGRLREAPARNAVLAIAIAAGLFGTWVQGLIDTVSIVIFGLWMPVMALGLSAASDGFGAEEA